MKQFKIGYQLYSVRGELQSDFEGTLKKISGMGYEYVEFYGFYDGKTAEEVKALLEKYNLKCISVHQGVDKFLEEGQAAVDFFKTIGVKYVIIPHYAASRHYGTPEWEKTKENFTKVGELLKKNGMKLGYHNHDFEFKTYEGKYLLDWLFEEIPADLIEPQQDTCWVHYAGVNPVEYIRKYAGRMNVLHLKDFACQKLGAGPVYALVDKNGNAQKKASKEDNGFIYRPLGLGIQDCKAILEAADEAGITYVIVEQDDSPERPPFEAAEISRTYLKEKFGL